ncbi:hypothetical protein ACVIHI_008543 [Bradyrhizobium sp. USDA 4524]|nr:hypothetical protein [Bradyrhizobium sp. USDA 4538]MCP1907370.1 hypothetical protein [Bradyrhizobium sp. USDA 4537]MCP1985156.1 hypothetical protein [Bradyrhizobium sp. USDA 4539]
MCKLRDFDTELKALEDKARDLRSREVLGLGELVIATGADALSADDCRVRWSPSRKRKIP